MQRYSFATIVTVNDGIPNATHLPFVVSQRDNNIILTSHFAKANPQANELLTGKPLVIFTEPHAYISPKHYDSKQSVPTWNYIAVHAYGKAVLIESAEDKAALLEQTVRYFEADYLHQWESLSNDFKLKMMKGITGFEIEVDELQGKQKLSQNKTPAERQRIIEKLSASNTTSENDIAKYMSKL